jgi:hypothetical protein
VIIDGNVTLLLGKISSSHGDEYEENEKSLAQVSW